MAYLPTKLDEQQMLSQLKDILLKEDRQELQRIRYILEARPELQERVDPIIKEHLDYLKANFPEEFRQVVDKQIEKKIKNSQEDLLAVLYPAMGKMIKKYITHQFELLRESIENQIQSRIRSGPIGWIRSKIIGVRESEWVLSKVGGPRIEGIYVIEKDSGLLLGSATLLESIDTDLMAGMLTAIKAFAEDAFQKDQAIDTISYDAFTIFLQNFPFYYIAVTLNGSLTSSERSRLSSDLFDFAEKELKGSIEKKEISLNLEIQTKLNKYFLTPQKHLNQPKH